MAVLPLNSSSKLDQEPNPFEQSFSGAAAAGIANKSDSRKEILNDKVGSQPEGSKPILPPVASITSPAPPLIAGGVLPKDVTNQFAWDSLRTGPLSPSMLQGPARPDNLDYTYRQIPQQSQQQRQQQSQQQSVNATSTTYGNQTANGVTFAHQYSSSSSPSSTTGTAGGGKIQKMENKPSQEEISGSSAARPQTRSRTQQKTTEDKPSNEEQSRKTNSRKRTATKDDGDEEYKESNSTSTKKRTRTQSKNVEDDEKRRNFLERNRIGTVFMCTCCSSFSGDSHNLSFSCIEVQTAQKTMAKQPASKSGDLDNRKRATSSASRSNAGRDCQPQDTVVSTQGLPRRPEQWFQRSCLAKVDTLDDASTNDGVRSSSSSNHTSQSTYIPATYFCVDSGSIWSPGTVSRPSIYIDCSSLHLGRASGAIAPSASAACIRDNRYTCTSTQCSRGGSSSASTSNTATTHGTG